MERFLLAILTGIALDIDSANDRYLEWLSGRSPGECSEVVDLFHQHRGDTYHVPIRRAAAAHEFLDALANYAVGT